MESKQLHQKEQHDKRAVDRRLVVGDSVFVKNYGQGSKWLPCVISRQTGPVSFVVTFGDGRERRVHQDQIRNRTVSIETLPKEVIVTPEEVPIPELPVDLPADSPVTSSTSDSSHESEPEPPAVSPVVSGGSSVPTPSDRTATPVVKTYPKRVCTGHVRFEPTVSWNTTQ